MKTLRVLVVGCGNMGASHARAYRDLPDFEIVGLVSRGAESRERVAAELAGTGGDAGAPPATFASFEEALAETAPDCVSINTYPDTHAAYARAALEADAHVFLEKPIATTVDEAREIVDLARARARKLVVGYILRVHPAWTKFIELAQGLGKPLVMRMNLNQQSRRKATGTTHRALMDSISPIVDCGVHYVDVMCQMTGARSRFGCTAIGARLTEELEAWRCTTTASCRSPSTMVPSAGTKPAGVR